LKILVTGCNGLLGQKLTALLDSDAEVELIATARKEIKYPLLNGKFIVLDAASKEDVQSVLSLTRPDVVIHTAAMTQVDQCETEQAECWLQNVTAVENIVDGCAKISARLIHLSTDFIFDGSHGPLDESERPAPLSHYGRSKLAGEEAVMRSKLDWAVLRTVLVYGVNRDMSRSNIVLWVRKSLQEGKPISVVDDQWRTPTLAEDLAIACVLAAKKKVNGIYHISGEEMMTPFDIAMRTADFFGLDQALITKTDSSKFRQPAERPPKTGFIIDKAKRDLGYKPRTFDEGLAIVKSQLP
jgi:dTDP-4-dehydrorhamnose reductase